MTRKRLTALLLFLCLSGIGSAQTTNAFRINYDIALFDLPIQSSEALTPGNYMFSGFHTNFLPIVSSLTEIDGTGNVLWAKRYSGGISYMFGDYKKDNSLNRYYVCGGSGNGPAFLMFVDATGNFISGRNFSIAQADGAFFNRVIKTSDDGYLCVGYVTGYDPDGAGPEVDFNSVTNSGGTCTETDTETIESPLIVKFDASGNHLWHHVVRYYMTSAIPANRIYNDASFVDVVEVSDGYLAVGNYDVNNVYSTFDSDDCSDNTPSDAVFFKTTTAGAITYHRQIDNPSNSTSQSSKNLVSATTTASGLPLISGTDGSGRPALLMRLPGSGAWANPTWIRKYGGALLIPLFGPYAPLLPSRFFETSDGNYGVWLNYLNGLSFSNVLMKVNSSTSAVTFAKNHAFNFASILPHGQQVSDGGYVGVSYTLSGSGHDMHFIKTDTNGDAPGACAATNVTISNETPSYTYGTPIYLSWNSNTVTNTTITPTVTNITPGTSVQCSFAPCTPPAAPTAAVATQPDCTTGTGSVTLSGLPTSGTWTVNGTPSGTATGNTATTTISGLAPGNYTFTVTLAGCTSAASNSVTINPAPTVPTAPVIGTVTQTTCTVGTGSIQLTGLPASGTWTVTGTPSGTATGTGTNTTISGLAPGSYTFTVSNGTCTSPSSLSTTINPQPSTPTAPVVGTITQPDCATPTGSVALSGLPASGSWTITASPGGSTQTGSGTTATFTGLAGGAGYIFTVTNASGCNSTASTSAAINVAPTPPSTPIVGTVTQPTCTTPTGSVALSGLPASGSWTITASPGALTQTGSGTTATFTGLTAGTNYTFTVTNAAGCTSTATSSVAINAVPGAPTAPVIGTITQPTCSVATGTIDLSGLPGSGTWTITGSPSGSASGTGTTTSISGLAAGSYTFTVTNDLGCTSSASLSAVINAQPTTPTAPLIGTVTQPDCTTPTGSVVLSGLPASGTWSITGTPSGSATGSGTTTTITGLAPGSSYTYTVTNAEGCTSSVSASTGVINAAPVVPTAPITGTVTQPTCTTPTGSVDLSGLPASGSWTITASPGALTQTGSGTTATFTGLSAGTNYTFTVTNDAGCTSTASGSVAINSVPGAPTAPTSGTVTQPTCAVPSGSFDVTAPLGAQYTYSIDGTTFQASTSFSGLAPGNYTITVLDNTSGCSSTSVAQVTINAVSGAPAVTLVTSEDVSCNSQTDGSLEISISGGTAPYTIAWTPNVGSGTTLSNLAAGSYSVNVTDDLGCSTTASFTIGTPAALAVNGVSSNVICGAGDGSITTAVSGGTAPYTYEWTPNGETTSNLSGLAAGSYGVTVTDDNGCTATQSFNVTIVGSLPVNIDPEYSEIEAGESVVLTATGADNYSWSPSAGLSCTDCPNPTASPDVTTTYYVTATDDNGCTGGDTALVVIKLPCGEIFVPTIFSPNGTGPQKNNNLCVFGTAACVEELIFEVYDRWGEKVFETTDITKCWDGNYKDKPMNNGIYVYRLYVKLWNNDEAIEQSGNTTLVR